MGKILAIDYGEARVGLALSDGSNNLATRLDIKKNTGKENLLNYLFELIKNSGIDTILIGIPTGVDGKETSMGDIIRKFSILLSEFLNEKGRNILIILRDETLTTHVAYDNLRELGMTHERIKTILDSESARILLQEYLDSIKENI